MIESLQTVTTKETNQSETIQNESPSIPHKTLSSTGIDQGGVRGVEMYDVSECQFILFSNTKIGYDFNLYTDLC